MFIITSGYDHDALSICNGVMSIDEFVFVVCIWTVKLANQASNLESIRCRTCFQYEIFFSVAGGRFGRID